jgi:pimeloyl-ACP methyl ester carboxylesterase
VPLLTSRGHVVAAPTLAGVGERVAELSDQITFDTHVSDVVDLLYARDLRDVVLVGHSYAGAVIAGVADRVPDRLRQLVFLDAVIIESGQSVGLPGGRDPRRPAAVPPPATSFGLADPADLAWVQRQLTPHPAGTFEPPLILDHPFANGVPVVYVACTRPAVMAHGLAQRLVQSNPAWRFVELAAGHDAMVTAPAALAELLERVAA